MARHSPPTHLQHHGVDEPDASNQEQHTHKQVGVSVELEVNGLRVEDGPNQLSLRCQEACRQWKVERN